MRLGVLTTLAGLLALASPAAGEESWKATSLSGAPVARSGHTAVWTGSKVIVWGGSYWNGSSWVYANTGGAYDPATDSWIATSTVGAPIGRASHTAVWTGSRMIVWGGMSSTYLDTGAIYDPATDSWAPTSMTGAPAARRDHTAVWTGSKMIVWSGRLATESSTSTGGIYDPTADAWTDTNTSGAPVARNEATAVWTGSRMIAWGGLEGESGAYSSSGGVYDPQAGSWTATPLAGAPSGRFAHTAVWTGLRMVVWGGAGWALMTTNTGGLYDPVLDSWTATTMVDVPPWRSGHAAVWTGTRMVVWGGRLSGNPSQGSTDPTATGGVYDPGIVSLPPFGSFDTPAHGATGVTGAIPVTGWTLDDVGVTNVEIYRDPMPGEPTRPNGKVYVGDATFVPGARPDVAAAYPAYPNADRAGWGYMLLTNMLPDQGNGPFTLYAYAYDGDNPATLLGSKAITCSNATATKPFGTIDTPAQGQTVSGSAYAVFGWALTPQPGTIPTDGSTLWVFVDGAPLAHPTYNLYRSDIATLFPGYANTDGAVGYFVFDTTALANGIHSIAWSVTDDLGRTDGIGSRYFWVQN